MEEKEETKKSRKKVVEDKIEDKKEVEIREVIVEKKVGFNYAEVIVIMIITLILGGMIGSFMSSFTKTKKVVNKVIKDELPAEMDEFLKTYNNIISEYYKDVDKKELLEAGINGMLNYLGDDYSVYMDKDTTKAFNEQVDGKYQGIGVEIVTVDNTTEITKVFSNSPASEAGLKIGDILLKVDDEDVSSMVAADIASKIKESGKDKVTILVKRGEEELSYTIKLREVNIDTVETKVFESNKKKVGYIYISIFSATTNEQFEKALLELEKKGIDSLIIDVRGNSGGYLNTVTDMASLFLNRSKVIYQLDTKGVVEQIFSNSKESRKYPIAVLIDGGSASASEILAAALQESYGAKVVGVNSYGKGTVQRAYQLSSGATVKYTVQKWLTPNGNWINEVGVKPDIEVKLSEEYANNPSDETDNQLQTAIKEVSK